MYKLLIICGSTATGKTNLALTLAHEFNGDLISADSRQVYRGMDIGTGKDISSSFELKNEGSSAYFTDGETKLWGIDLVLPNEDFSVTDFVRFAIPVITSLWEQGRLPIIVGGTGLYIRALRQFLAGIAVPRNQTLRKELLILSVPSLQEKLQQLDMAQFASMNNSDRNNPRRLIRAIEIATWKKTNPQKLPWVTQYEAFLNQQDVLLIGLTVPAKILKQRIALRVDERVADGVITEVKTLVNQGFGWELPAMTGLGYRQWRDYFKHKKSETAVIADWKLAEAHYAKRQMTWFKKEKNINWFDSNQLNFKSNIMALVRKWLKE